MYLYNDGFTYYGTYGCQQRSRGRFLILLDNGGKELRAIVRTVALRQLGHWMMGYARVYGESLTVSGTYGSDGLPKHIDTLRFPNGEYFHHQWRKPSDEWIDRVWQSATPVPQELYDMWATGGGHNSAGSEGPSMRQWGRSIDHD